MKKNLRETQSPTNKIGAMNPNLDNRLLDQKENELVKDIDSKIEDMVLSGLETFYNDLIRLREKFLFFENDFHRVLLLASDKISLYDEMIGKNKNRLIYFRDLCDQYHFMASSLASKIPFDSVKIKQYHQNCLKICDEVKTKVDKIYNRYTSVLGKQFIDIDPEKYPMPTDAEFRKQLEDFIRAGKFKYPDKR